RDRRTPSRRANATRLDSTIAAQNVARGAWTELDAFVSKQPHQFVGAVVRITILDAKQCIRHLGRRLPSVRMWAARSFLQSNFALRHPSADRLVDRRSTDSESLRKLCGRMPSLPKRNQTF